MNVPVRQIVIDRREIAEAIQRWHRGEMLTTRQHEIVEDARIDTTARAIALPS